jgi:hypothetical protein
MSNSAKSMLVYGVYYLGAGVTLLIIPNVFLGVLGLPPTNEVWIRVIGMLLFLLSFYYILGARNELRVFFKWTVYTRGSVVIFFVIFVLLGFVKPVLILLGVVDLAGAIWTSLALRSSKNI